MLIKPRKVRKPDKFTSRWILTSRRRKEQIASLYSMAFVQLVLFCFLIAGAYWSFAAIEARTSGLRWIERFGVPLFFLAAGALSLRASIRNFREARETSKPPPEDEAP